ncbi:MAG: hypothetical protein OET79_10880, partial [Nitrospirota bacterium]|nr:hypothetical protein [Nitrospirota bacterium]
ARCVRPRANATTHSTAHSRPQPRALAAKEVLLNGMIDKPHIGGCRGTGEGADHQFCCGNERVARPRIPARMRTGCRTLTVARVASRVRSIRRISAVSFLSFGYRRGCSVLLPPLFPFAATDLVLVILV